MLYTLGVTGCSSRVAMSGMLRGFAESFARAPLQISPGFLLPDPDRPNVPVCPYGCRGMAIVASFPAVFGPSPKGVWRSEPLDWESASLHLSTPIFLSSLAPPGGARGAGAGRLLLDKVYAFLRAAIMMWRARAGAGRLLPLPCWARSMPSFAPPCGVRGAGAGLLLLIPCWTRSTPAFLRTARRRHEAGRLLLLPYWPRSTPSFVLPGGVRGAGAVRLRLLPYWTWSTPSSLRFAGGDGAQRRSGRRIFGTRPKGRTARTGRSVAHTLRCLYQRRRLKRRVSEGGAARYKHDHAPGAEERDRPRR